MWVPHGEVQRTVQKGLLDQLRWGKRPEKELGITAAQQVEKELGITAAQQAEPSGTKAWLGGGGEGQTLADRCPECLEPLPEHPVFGPVEPRGEPLLHKHEVHSM